MFDKGEGIMQGSAAMFLGSGFSLGPSLLMGGERVMHKGFDSKIK